MKTDRLLFLLALLLPLIACHKQDERQWLKQAATFLPAQPDSAWQAIRQIRFPEQLSGKEKADYWLFHAMARRNSDQSFINDSLLRQSIDYYLSVNDSTSLEDAYRLEAQRQEWLGHPSIADSLYRKAIQFHPADEVGLCALYDKLVMLHGNHINPKDYPRARTYARQLIAISQTPSWKAHAYYQLAVNYNLEGLHPDSAVYYTYKCLAYVKQLPKKEQPFYLSNCANMFGLDAREALSLNQEAMTIDSTFECSGTCTQGYIYLSMSRVDSALLCYEKAMKLYKEQFVKKGKGYPTLHNSLTTLYACVTYALHPKDAYLRDFIYNDSIQTASYRQRLINEENNTIQQDLKDRQINLELQQQHMRFLLALSLGAFILIAAITYIYIRHRKQLWIASEEKIEALELIIKQAQSNTSDEPAPDGAFFRRILLKQLGMIRLIASTPTNANQDLLRQFNQIGQDTDTNAPLLIWEELYPIIDASYANFHTKLINNYGDLLNEKEIQLCCLLRADFTTKEINVVTGQSVSTIYHRKIDIRRKLNLEGTGALSDFLISLNSHKFTQL